MMNDQLRIAHMREASADLSDAIFAARSGNVPRVSKYLRWGREAAFSYNTDGPTFAAEAWLLIQADFGAQSQ